MINDKRQQRLQNAKENLINEMISRGWVINRFGHLVKGIACSVRGERCIIPHRIKFLLISVRLEVKYDNNWRLKGRSFFSDIKYEQDGSLCFAGVRFKSKKVES